jgi:hypothetical protein
MARRWAGGRNVGRCIQTTPKTRSSQNIGSPAQRRHHPASLLSSRLCLCKLAEVASSTGYVAARACRSSFSNDVVWLSPKFCIALRAVQWKRVPVPHGTVIEGASRAQELDPNAALGHADRWLSFLLLEQTSPSSNGRRGGC